MISLSKSFKQNKFNKENKFNEIKDNDKIIIEKEEKVINNLLLNNEIQTEIGENSSKNAYNNEIENAVLENEGMIRDMNNSNDLDFILIEGENFCQKELSLEEMGRKEINIKQKMENINRTKNIIPIELDCYDNYYNVDNIINNDNNFDDNYIFLPGDNNVFSSDEISSESKDYLSLKIMESSYFKSLSSLFS